LFLQENTSRSGLCTKLHHVTAHTRAAGLSVTLIFSVTLFVRISSHILSNATRCSFLI